MIVVVGLTLFAGCSDSSSSTSSAPGATTRTDRPSEAAKMICAPEAQKDIAEALGTRTAEPVTATWSDSVYSCPYSYRDGTMAISVKQLPDLKPTVAYFDKLARDLGKDPNVFLSFGTGSFLTDQGSVVVRKDNMVLLVDVKALPDHFGHPSAPRSSTAETVARTIMGCWTGADHGG